MKKLLVFVSLFLIFSQKICASQPRPTGSVSVNGSAQFQYTLKDELIKAGKKAYEYAAHSRKAQGAAIGTCAGIIADLFLYFVTDMLLEKQDPLFPQQNKKPPTSFLSIALASAYGAYLTNNRPNNFGELAIHGALASVAPAVGYTLYRVLKERWSENAEQYGAKKNLKNGIKQTFLDAVAFFASYYSTVELQKLEEPC